jgi:BolA family transcriptional regulator, general stress-responsive regulator
MNARIGRMHQKLTDAFKPTEIEIIDESHLHAGHAGARDGRGHYALRIRAQAFEGRKPLERHRMVYAALADMMQTDIHALSIKAFAPAE